MAEQNKLGLGEILNAVGIIALSVCIFFGLLFINEASLVMSALETVFIVLALFGITALLMKLKSTDENQNDMKKWEMVVLLVGYGTMFIATLFLFTHFMNMQFNAKEEIKRQGKAQLEGISKMFTDYESHVDLLLKDYNTTLDNEGKSESQRDRNVEAVKTKLFIGYEEEKRAATTYTNKGHAILDKWSLLKVPETYYNIPLDAKKWKENLVRLSKTHSLGEETPFKTTTEEVNILDLSNPKAFLGNTSWLLTLLPFLALHLMILWPYLFASRSASNFIDGKSGGKSGFEM